MPVLSVLTKIMAALCSVGGRWGRNVVKRIRNCVVFTPGLGAVVAIFLAVALAQGQTAIPLPPEAGMGDSGQPPAASIEQDSGETLDDAFRTALATDQRVEAGQWNVSSAESTWAAARGPADAVAHAWRRLLRPQRSTGHAGQPGAAADRGPATIYEP